MVSWHYLIFYLKQSPSPLNCPPHKLGLRSMKIHSPDTRGLATFFLRSSWSCIKTFERVRLVINVSTQLIGQLTVGAEKVGLLPWLLQLCSGQRSLLIQWQPSQS